MSQSMIVWLIVIAYCAWAIPMGVRFMASRWPAAWANGGLGIKVVQFVISAVVGLAFGTVFAALWILKFVLRLTTGR